MKPVKPILSLQILIQIANNLRTNEISNSRRQLLNTLAFGLESLLAQEENSQPADHKTQTGDHK